MAHGQPDFGMYQIAATIYRLTDMAELAVRLGSPVTYDRRGDVVYFDDFEDGIEKLETATLGTGAAVAWDATRARTKGFCCKMTTGDVVGNQTTILKRLPPPVPSKWGAEISFTTLDTLGAIYLSVGYYNGTHLKRGQVRWRATEQDLAYEDSAGDYQVFATGIDLEEIATLFHFAKLVVDFVNYKYTRFILNEVEYDLSAYGLYSFADATTSPHLAPAFVCRAGLAVNQDVYIDDIIITQNEP